MTRLIELRAALLDHARAAYTANPTPATSRAHRDAVVALALAAGNTRIGVRQ